MHIDSLKTPIERAFISKNLKAIQSINSELARWIASLSQSDQDELEAILNGGFKIVADPLAEANEVLKRNKIGNVTEYRLMIDVTSDYEIPEELMKKFNVLIESYPGPFEE